jgi:hypothetical protein
MKRRTRSMGEGKCMEADAGRAICHGSVLVSLVALRKL